MTKKRNRDSDAADIARGGFRVTVCYWFLLRELTRSDRPPRSPWPWLMTTGLVCLLNLDEILTSFPGNS